MIILFFSLMSFEPAYLKLYHTGELKKRAQELYKMLNNCYLCPRLCGVNRVKGEKGVCNAGAQVVVASYYPHFGEEKGLVGKNGSGAIFFSNCGLRCVFCINWEISHAGMGSVISIEKLANIMVSLQKKGCHNINLVTPDHYLPQILLALNIAVEKGLRLPIVYNTCGWVNLEIVKKLDGIVDIYLPDFKYWDPRMAKKYSFGAKNYPEVTKKAILEMHRQVGVAKPKEDGIIYRGLMIRHLVMPNNVGGSKEIIKWISENLPKDTYLNIMSQYRPMYKAVKYKEIARIITKKEYEEVVNYAKNLGLTNLDIQGYRW